MIRCVVCGCSRLDSQGYKCARCGGPLGVRTERCHITEDTKARLLAHAEELNTFGVTLEEQRPLGKSFGDICGGIALALAVAESLNSGILHKLILYLREIGIPQEQILRLRLDEPEHISDLLSTDESEDYGSDTHSRQS